MKTYRDYFDIDPDYIPAIDERTIENKPELWKKFYPHETFIKLLKTFVNVLDRKQHFTTFTLPRKLMKPVYTRPALSPLDFLRFGL